MLRVWSLLALSWLALGCVVVNTPPPIYLPPPGSVRPATLDSSSPRGFYTLYVNNSSFERVGKVEFAQSRSELLTLQKYWHISAPVPEVDFSRHVVVAFSMDDDACLDELTAFSLDDRGVLRPKFEGFKSWCEIPLLATVYFVALARAALPPHIVVSLKGGGVLLPAAGELTLEGPTEEPAPDETGSLKGPLGALRATLSLPPEGDVVAQVLDDGTPVWLVHHAGGEVSVLSAFSPEPLDEYKDDTHVSSVKYLIPWEPRTRRFDEGYDERGVPVLGRVWPSLSRHRAEITSGPACAAARSPALEPGSASPGSASRCVRVGDVAPGSPRRHVAPRPNGEVKSSMSSHLYGRKGGISVDEALAKHEGRVVLLDASLVIAGHEPPHICKVHGVKDVFGNVAYRGQGMDTDVRCPAGAPVPVGLEALECDACITVAIGPLFARVEGGRLHDLGRTSRETLDFELPGTKRSPDPLILSELGVGVTTVFDSGGVHSGGTELNWGIRRVLVPEEYDQTGTAMRMLVGNVYGFDLRAAFTLRREGESVESNLALGIAGRLNQSYVGGLRLPSLLGLLVPEIGVLVDSREPARLYLGTSFPVAFHREFGLWGVEIMPAVRYVPATDSFMGVVSLKGLDRW